MKIETPDILKIYIFIHFKEESNSVIVFTPILVVFEDPVHFS